MEVHPKAYRSAEAYAGFYIQEPVAQKRIIAAIHILQNKIERYTHKNVLQFLTDKDFRAVLLKEAEKSTNRYVKARCRDWQLKYEAEVGKKNWWIATVHVVSSLEQAEELEPLQPGTAEALIYEVIVSSEQQLIPVAYPNRLPYKPNRMEVFYKCELLEHFDVLGLRFLSFGIVTLGNKVPVLHLEIPRMFWPENRLLNIYLPADEMKELYMKLTKAEFPKGWEYGEYNHAEAEKMLFIKDIHLFF